MNCDWRDCVRDSPSPRAYDAAMRLDPRCVVLSVVLAAGVSGGAGCGVTPTIIDAESSGTDSKGSVLTWTGNPQASASLGLSVTGNDEGASSAENSLSSETTGGVTGSGDLSETASGELATDSSEGATSADATSSGDEGPSATATVSGADSDQGDDGGSSQNHPPSARAGRAVMTTGSSVVLGAHQSFDADGDSLAYYWQQIQGPVAAIIEDPRAAGTRAELPVPGHYAFRVRVDDGQAYDEAEVGGLRRNSDDALRAEYVIHISVDGLRPDIVLLLGSDELPAMFRLRREGAYTNNARADITHTITVPNHVSQVTGRFVSGAQGHGYDINATVSDRSIHDQKGEYVASIFDVVHDAGLHTAYYATKTKMNVIPFSFTGQTGAQDLIPPNHGRAKIDEVYVDWDLDQQTARFVQHLRERPPEYGFFHISAPDDEGHSTGWVVELDSPYADGVRRADAALGRILETVESSALMRNRTTIILTSDHGGEGLNHTEAELAVNYTIPFYVWGAGIEAARELYSLNPDSRMDPGVRQVADLGVSAPIRNADAANLATTILGLGTIPGSTINVQAPLVVSSESAGD